MDSLPGRLSNGLVRKAVGPEESPEDGAAPTTSPGAVDGERGDGSTEPAGVIYATGDCN